MPVSFNALTHQTSLIDNTSWNPCPFSSNFLSITEADQLKPDDMIDFRKDDGKFILVKISQKQNSFLLLESIGINNKYNKWCNYKIELHRFAKPYSISTRQAHTLKHLQTNDFIDVSSPFQIPIYQYSEWKYAQIIQFDDNSDQIKVRLFYNEHTFWTHLDNKSEVALFRSKYRSKLYVPYPQTMNRSLKIVNTFVMSSEKLLFTNSFQQIPFEISQQIALFYHHSKSLPIFTNYEIGDKLQVKNQNEWVLCKVIEKHKKYIVAENNYTRSYKINLIKGAKLLRKCLDNKYKIDNEFERLWWNKRQVADGESFYGCFANEIYDDRGQSDKMKRQCDRYISDNIDYFETLPEWKMVMVALCELHNVRVRLFEYDTMYEELFMSFEYGVCKQTQELPMIMLFEQDEYYHIIRSPALKYTRPLNRGYHVAVGKPPTMNMLQFRRRS
eukprot:87928_1